MRCRAIGIERLVLNVAEVSRSEHFFGKYNAVSGYYGQTLIRVHRVGVWFRMFKFEALESNNIGSLFLQMNNFLERATMKLDIMDKH